MAAKNKTTGKCEKSLQMSEQASNTFDSLLVYYSHEEALLVNIAAIHPVLGCALIQQPVHKGGMGLPIAIDPSYCLQHRQGSFETACHKMPEQGLSATVAGPSNAEIAAGSTVCKECVYKP